MYLLLIAFFQSSACLAAFSEAAPFSLYDDWDPYVAVDRSPGSHWAYMLTKRVSPFHINQKIMLRAFNGSTWLPEVPVCGQGCCSGIWQADPSMAVSDKGILYICLLRGFQEGPVIIRSFDHGESFTHTVVWKNASGWIDKPWMAISPHGDGVYVAWYGEEGLHIARSLDGGDSFEEPVKLTIPNFFWFPEGGIVSPRTRAILFSASAENPDGLGDVILAVMRSTDNGIHWTFHTLAASCEAPLCSDDCNSCEYQATTALAVDEEGTIIYVYASTDSAGNAKSLYAFSSQDDGVTWEGPHLIYQPLTESEIGDASFPAVSAGSKPGQFGVIWQDNRNGACLWNTYFKCTNDGGKSWSSEICLSNSGTEQDFIYKSNRGYQFPYNDYMALAADNNGTFYAIWGEGVGRNSGGHCWYSVGKY